MARKEKFPGAGVLNLASNSGLDILATQRNGGSVQEDLTNRCKIAETQRAMAGRGGYVR